jgi:hypothetical protein
LKAYLFYRRALGEASAFPAGEAHRWRNVRGGTYRVRLKAQSVASKQVEAERFHLHESVE